MPKVMKNSTQYSGSFSNAINIKYDNTYSKLNSSNVQEAIDELNSNKATFLGYVTTETKTITTDSYADVTIDVSAYGNRNNIAFAFSYLDWCVGGAWWEDDTHIHVQLQNPFGSQKPCHAKLALFSK